MQTQIFIQRRRKKWRSLTKKFRAFRCIEFLKKIQISGRLCKKKKERNRKVLVSVAPITSVIMSIITISVIPVSSRAWRSPISEFGIGTVPGKVTTLSALIASHARIKSTASTASSSRLGNRHTNAATTDFLTIYLSLGFLGILPVSIHHKSKTGHRPGHPNLF